MRKLLITKRLTAFLWALVLTLMPMSLMADNTPLSVSVTDELGSFANETARNAFDGITTNKWCGGIRTQSSTNAYVQVRLAEKSKLDYYYLYTGNDINYEDNGGKQQRNPKEWKLYAKVNEGDEWTLISHVTDAGLPTTVSTRSNNYKVDAAYQNIEYNYLKFQILQIEQGTIFEVGEICFINCNHTFGELIPAKEPTCTEDGNIAYHQCKDCEKYFDLEGNELAEGEWVRPAAGHQLGDLISVKEPTCTEAGASKAYHQCSACNKYFDEEGNELAEGDCVIPALGHDIQWVVIQELTCTQKGIEGDRCVRCGGLPDDYFGLGLETAAPGHRFELYSVDIEPTCTESGTSTYKCRNCGEIEVKPTNPQHNFGDDLKCINCDYFVDVDCVIEYTATERLSNVSKYVLEDEKYNEVLDYTDKIPDCWWLEPEPENFGEYLFGAPAIKHEYDEATGKGRIICNAPVTGFMGYTELRPERLTSITLPSTVEFVDGYAFFDCSNLTSITLLAEFSAKLNYSLNFIGCNNLQEIIVPYNSIAKYLGACSSNGNYYMYKDENGDVHDGPTYDLLKSLLPLDDTKAFETPESEVKVDATLQRSFANDGWYSLCVPFSVSVADSPFSQVAEFSELDGDTYRFTTVDAIEAGKAYIVKVDATVANPTFKNVFITTEAPATDGDFIGVYGPTVLGDGCKVIGSGTTVNPVNPGTMKGFRCYFKPSQAGAKTMYFSVDDGVATAIESSEFDTLPSPDNHHLSSYNLSGQKVDDSYRGIVVKNGKKYMNK